MKDKVRMGNYVKIIGKIMTEFSYSHSIFDKNFFTTKLEVPRLSKIVDEVPLTISEDLITINHLNEGKYIEVIGQFRSYNKNCDGKNKLILTVFAKECLPFYYQNEEDIVNYINLEGFVCKAPVYRTTPFGREITDVLIAVNRAYNKSDYIPCICWGNNARYANRFKVGDKVKLNGRIQSRNYQKKINDEVLQKVAYEVSIAKIELL